MNELPAENSQSLRPELMESFEEWNQTAGAWPLKRLVAMWNDLPGVTPVQKFTSREVALQRIWRFMHAPEQRSVWSGCAIGRLITTSIEFTVRWTVVHPGRFGMSWRA